LVEIDRQLVAFDVRHAAVAEFLVEDALAARILRGAGVAGLHGPGLRLDQRRARAPAALAGAMRLGSAPARAVVSGCELLRLRFVSETKAAAVEAFIDDGVDVVLRQLGDETRGQRALPASVHAAVGGEGDTDALLGARETHVSQAPLLFKPRESV